MAGETVIRGVVRPMTVHAEPHVVVDDALGDRLLGDVAVTRRAVDLRPDVRRVVEADVRLTREAVHALPRDLDPLVRIVGDLFDERMIGRDLTVADHARLDAGDAGDRPLLDALVAVGALRLFLDVRLVRERDRLLRLRPDGEVIPGRLAEGPVRRGEDR